MIFNQRQLIYFKEQSLRLRDIFKFSSGEKLPSFWKENIKQYELVTTLLRGNGLYTFLGLIMEWL